jgi:hypothetical protein
MKDETKALILLVSLGTLIVIFATYAQFQRAAKAQALHECAVLEGKLQEATQLRQKLAQKQAADQQVMGIQAQRIADAEAQLLKHPIPAPSKLVPSDATSTAVAQGFQELGLSPVPNVSGLQFTLTDGRISLGMGRESLRVPGLQSRIIALEDVVSSTKQQINNMTTVIADDAAVLSAADKQASLYKQQVAALQRALQTTPKERLWAVGGLVGTTAYGDKAVGAFVDRDFSVLRTGAEVTYNTYAMAQRQGWELRAKLGFRL